MLTALTMLDYIKRKMPKDWTLNRRAEELLSAVEWPEDDCECKCCAKPEEHRFYDIPGRGPWLIGSKDHEKFKRQHPDWKPMKSPTELTASEITGKMKSRYCPGCQRQTNFIQNTETERDLTRKDICAEKIGPNYGRWFCSVCNRFE